MVKTTRDFDDLVQQAPDSPDALALLTKMMSGIPGLVETPITGEEVDFHDSPKITLPHGMTFEKANKILTRLQQEAEEETSFTRMFRYRPDDGAYAAFQVVKEMWGMSLGKATYSFFGKNPPEMRTINIGVGQTMQVPWGLLQLPTLPGLDMYIGDTNDRDYGKVFGINCTGPRKYKDEIEKFFDRVEEYLRDHSIYRGRAIIGSNEPEFLDLGSFNPDQIVFSDEVTHMLEGSLWSPIRYTEAMRRESVPLKRAVLLHGPYGTGKTSVGQLTALVATENKWTFISARPGRDKPEDVLRTARLYQPAVVFLEDIDTSTSTGDADEVSKFLDAFDGITSKGGELVAVMTTNHLDRIHKGMLRPGRLDAVVEIHALDRNGCERLIRAVIEPSKLADGVDFDAVYESMEGFFPAFIRESITRAVTFAIGRNEGSIEYVIDTADLVGAAHSLKPQLDALNNAAEGHHPPTLDQAVEDAIVRATSKVSVYSPEYSTWGELAEVDDNGERVKR